MLYGSTLQTQITTIIDIQFLGRGFYHIQFTEVESVRKILSLESVNVEILDYCFRLGIMGLMQQLWEKAANIVAEKTMYMVTTSDINWGFLPQFSKPTLINFDLRTCSCHSYSYLSYSCTYSS
jgi:hypothetical protein